MQKLIEHLKAPILSGPDLNYVEVYHIIPEGWNSLAIMSVRLTQLMKNCIVEAGVKDGLIVIRFKGNNQVDNDICELFRHIVAKQSSLMCMICGGRAMRRKAETPIPTLCGPHYVEYVNYLDQIGNNGLQI
jgi:hypothetical protein